MPRMPEREMFLPRQSKTKTNDSESEASARIREELRALIADERYQRQVVSQDG